MSLQELIMEAAKKDKVFRKEFNYWVKIRQENPKLGWLMPRLVRVLGEKYVGEQARLYIASKKRQE